MFAVRPGIESVLDQKRVLIIEDQMLIAINVEQVALDMGAADTRVVRADEAVRTPDVWSDKPDVCIIDYRAASGRGSRLAQLARKHDCKLIVMTTDSLDRDDELIVGADAILRKPFSDDDVRAALEKVLFL